MMKTETLFNENLKEADEKEQDNLGAETHHMCPQEGIYLWSNYAVNWSSFNIPDSLA